MKKALGENLYKKISIGDLILFSIHSLGKKADFEKLVEECFNLFPASFSFPSHPKWPDSRKLDRSLRALRKDKLIKGDPQTSFSLTLSGKKRAEKTAKDFRQGRLKL